MHFAAGSLVNERGVVVCKEVGAGRACWLPVVDQRNTPVKSCSQLPLAAALVPFLKRPVVHTFPITLHILSS